jgi:ribose 5-phosphate isomerase A
MSQDDDKRRAAIAAADEVKNGMLVGLGTGSTAVFLIDELGRRFADGLRFRAVATSLGS